MARDLSSDVEALQEQIADLRSALVKQAKSTAGDATSYLAPRVKRIAKDFRHEGYDLTDAVRRNPAAATGAVIGALALGTILGLLLSSGDRKDY